LRAGLWIDRRRGKTLYAMSTAPCPSPATGIDHVGIRVSDRERSIAFYERLGFVQTDYFREHQANEMETAAGVRINLIFNGARSSNAHNALLDAPIKLPGITHPAFLVDDLHALARWLGDQGIRITEGPERIGPRRIALFIRDPDGNVLEFDQLLREGQST
jgi:lactoylglutathione lyase